MKSYQSLYVSSKFLHLCKNEQEWSTNTHDDSFGTIQKWMLAFSNKCWLVWHSSNPAFLRAGVHVATNWLPFDGSQNSISRLSFKLNLFLNVFLIKLEYGYTTLLSYFTSYTLRKSWRIAEQLNHITNALIRPGKAIWSKVKVSILKICHYICENSIFTKKTVVTKSGFL